MKKLILLFTIGAIIFLSACGTNKVDSNETKSTAAKNMEEYFKSHDTIYLAENAVFKNMTYGEETKGRKAIAEMLHYLYHVAFDAKADVKHTMVTDKNAVLEATFTGKHIADFAGVPASGNQVNVPLCVTYDLNKDGLIQEARIYMQVEVLMQQLKSK